MNVSNFECHVACTRFFLIFRVHAPVSIDSSDKVPKNEGIAVVWSSGGGNVGEMANVGPGTKLVVNGSTLGAGATLSD